MTLNWLVVFLLVGGLLFWFGPGKSARMGEIVFACAMFWLAYSFGHQLLHL